MGTNFVEKGESPEVVAPSGGVTTGEFFVIGSLAGVAATTADEGDGVAMQRHGAFSLPKATGFAYAQGDLAYWDVADENFNNDTANNAQGIVLEAAGTDATEAVIILLPAKITTAAAAAARLDILEDLFQAMPAVGTQKAMTSNDTYVNFTEDALTFAANTIAARDVINFEFVWKVDSMNAAGLTTFGLLLGALDLGTVAVSTADANDYARLSGSLTFKTVGASCTVTVVLRKTGSDGGTVTSTELITFAATGPATTSAVVITPRSKTATGHADAKATLHAAWAKLEKAA